MSDAARPHPDIIAIGASAGGLEATEALLMRLPPSLPAAILVVLHTPPERVNYLPDIFKRLRAGPVAKEGNTGQAMSACRTVI
jgi:two-component system, chemotaxis family, protein-glutamate methylesterase/glutaminase